MNNISTQIVKNTPVLLNTHMEFKQKIGNIIYSILIIIATIYSSIHYQGYMDIYEQIILYSSGVGLIIFGIFWHSWRLYFITVGVLSILGISLYQNDLTRAQTNFFLKYLLSSQSAMMWMCTLFYLATIIYWAGLLKRSAFLDQFATKLTWAASIIGFSGLFIRWAESYLISPDMGHIPVSNLYEVFILFCLITALMYLFYAERLNTHKMGAFVLLIICSAVTFILWYTFERQAHEIQPLIPALQSWWMKIHVPANFIGYGAFAIAAMLAIAERLASKGIWLNRLPTIEILDEVMYRAIAIGFLFFTIATILGAMWAADAWGSYWSWDPKETWALIVWLNYATWLHVRLVKGWRGAVLSWWAIIGLFVTSFAFVGVNLFLSGLHSYGSL